MRSLYQTLEGMCLRFEPSASEGTDATLQFEVSGDEPGTYHLRIHDRTCAFRRGAVDSPTLIFRTPSDVWLRISRGEISGRDALLQGLYEVEGDPGLLLQMNDLFPPGDEVVIEAPSRQRPAGPLRLTGDAWLAIDFLPWIFLWAVFGSDGRGGWPALAAGFVASAALVAYRTRYQEATIFEMASLGVHGAMLCAWPLASVWLMSWGATVGTILLGAIWLATLWPGHTPLTTAYSKWRYVPALWINSSFLHVNAVLTLAWGWVFVLQGGLEIGASAAPGLSPALTFGRYGLLAVALILTLYYPRRAPELHLADPDLTRARLRSLAVPGLVAACGLTLITMMTSRIGGL